MPVFTKAEWHNNTSWTPPSLPHDLKTSPLKYEEPLKASALATLEPSFWKNLKDSGSRRAKVRQNFFKYSALVIVGAHLLATLLATLALKVKDHHDVALRWLLGGEVLLLLLGLAAHIRVHSVHASRGWAMSRVVAEIARSVRAMEEIHVHLDYLFHLPFPTLLRPLLRTWHVLCLAATKSKKVEPRTAGEKYLSGRFKQQVDYYRTGLAKARFWSAMAGRVFYVAAVGAVLATTTKLLSSCHLLPSFLHPVEASLPSWLGLAAILLPVLAVGALSLAASFDLEARIHTFEDVLAHLEASKAPLENATTAIEFTRLAMHCEAHLLGEIATWVSRRSFTGIT